MLRTLPVGRPSCLRCIDMMNADTPRTRTVNITKAKIFNMPPVSSASILLLFSPYKGACFVVKPKTLN